MLAKNNFCPHRNQTRKTRVIQKANNHTTREPTAQTNPLNPSNIIPKVKSFPQQCYGLGWSHKIISTVCLRTLKSSSKHMVSSTFYWLLRHLNKQLSRAHQQLHWCLGQYCQFHAYQTIHNKSRLHGSHSTKNGTVKTTGKIQQT